MMPAGYKLEGQTLMDRREFIAVATLAAAASASPAFAQMGEEPDMHPPK
jgi:hypothetical protein